MIPNLRNRNIGIEISEINDSSGPSRMFDKDMLKAVLAFVAGTVGIVFGAGPFIHSLQGFSLEVGVSVIILAVIISPIAGEMPEKISMMILARKGASGRVYSYSQRTWIENPK